MVSEQENKISFAKYCPLLLKDDSGNLVSVHVDLADPEFVASESHCNHAGIPRVEKMSDGFIKSTGRIVAACDGCVEFTQGFEKPLETNLELDKNIQHG